MRKLLKKYAFVPDRLVTDDLRSYGAAARDLGIESRHERGRRKNNRAEEFASTNSTTGAQDATILRAPVQPRNSFQFMPPFTTPSTSNAIWLRPKRTACFALLP